MRPTKAPFAPPMRAPETRELLKREFLQQYVLNRARKVDGLSGERAAKEALAAWETIEKSCGEK